MTWFQLFFTLNHGNNRLRSFFKSLCSNLPTPFLLPEAYSSENVFSDKQLNKEKFLDLNQLINNNAKESHQ